MKSLGYLINRWIVSKNNYNPDEPFSNKIDWIRALPFLMINLSSGMLNPSLNRY